MKGLHPSPASGMIPAQTLQGATNSSGQVTVDMPRTEAASHPELRENLRVTAEVLEELYFRADLHVGDGTVSAGALFDSAVVPGLTTVEYPAAGSPTWRVDRRRRARWQRAAIRLTLVYTATAGSTAPFVFDLRTREFAAGDVMPPADILSVNFLLPGPAIANTLLSFVYVSPGVAVNGAKPGLDFRMMRTKGDVRDTNANSLHVAEALWQILPL